MPSMSESAVGQLIEGAVDTIRGLALEDIDPDAIVWRKLPWDTKLKGQYKQFVIVSPDQDELVQRRNNCNDWVYRFSITVARQSSGNLVGGFDLVSKWRHDIATAFHNEHNWCELSGQVGTLWRCEVELGPQVDHEAFQNLFDMQIITINCHVREATGG